MIFAGCTAIGMKLSARLQERQRALQKLSESLLSLKNQICGLGIPLFTAFENIAKESIGGVWSGVFLDCGRIMKEQRMDAGSAWREAVQSEKDQLPLEASDWEMLSDFGEMLGKSDRQLQESVLEMEKEKISAMEKKAREVMETKGKLYRTLGALSGAAAVILLI
ncbi:MAG: stage III sporulation protein AB [Clostridia bacterium]|nr:stage III sporulation protein AB [Clostridia bacterium]